MAKGRRLERECVAGAFRATVEVGVYEDGRCRSLVCLEDNRPLGIRMLDDFAYEGAGTITVGGWDDGIAAQASLFRQVGEALSDLHWELQYGTQSEVDPGSTAISTPGGPPLGEAG